MRREQEAPLSSLKRRGDVVHSAATGRLHHSEQHHGQRWFPSTCEVVMRLARFNRQRWHVTSSRCCSHISASSGETHSLISISSIIHSSSSPLTMLPRWLQYFSSLCVCVCCEFYCLLSPSMKILTVIIKMKNCLVKNVQVESVAVETEHIHTCLKPRQAGTDHLYLGCGSTVRWAGFDLLTIWSRRTLNAPSICGGFPVEQLCKINSEEAH